MHVFLAVSLCSFFGVLFKAGDRTQGLPCTWLGKLSARVASSVPVPGCSSSMHFLLPPAGGALFSLWAISFLVPVFTILLLRSSPHAANAQSSVLCATHAHPSLHHNTGLFATESLRESETPFNTILASKGLYFRAMQRKPGYPPHAYCTHVTGLNIMGKHPL